MVVAFAAACAGGEGDGSVLTLGPSTVGQNTSTSSSDASTSDAEASTATGAAQTDATSSPTSADGTETSVGSSGDTGMAGECDAVLETFAADPAWPTVGLPDGGTVFGWSATANAGGAVGEVGGTLQRSGNSHQYADTAITVAAGDCIAAQGRIVMPMEAADYNAVVHFGHFSTSGGPSIGFSFAENPNSTLRVYLEAGSVSQQVFVMEDIATPRTWSYEYDPAMGTMTLEMEGLGSQSVPVAPADVGSIDAIDAFGWYKTPHETPEVYPGVLAIYLDEIAYTR
jgi:hypothetical protein